MVSEPVPALLAGLQNNCTRVGYVTTALCHIKFVLKLPRNLVLKAFERAFYQIELRLNYWCFLITPKGVDVMSNDTLFINDLIGAAALYQQAQDLLTKHGVVLEKNGHPISPEWHLLRTVFQTHLNSPFIRWRYLAKTQMLSITTTGGVESVVVHFGALAEQMPQIAANLCNRLNIGDEYLAEVNLDFHGTQPFGKETTLCVCTHPKNEHKNHLWQKKLVYGPGHPDYPNGATVTMLESYRQCLHCECSRFQNAGVT